MPPCRQQDASGRFLCRAFADIHSHTSHFPQLLHSFCTSGHSPWALQKAGQLSCLWLNTQQSLVLSTLASVGLCSHHCPLQREASLPEVDTSLTWGHKHGSLEGNLIGTSCPFSKMSAVTSPLGSMKSLGSLMWGRTQIQSMWAISSGTEVPLLCQWARLAWLAGWQWCKQGPQPSDSVDDNSLPAACAIS